MAIDPTRAIFCQSEFRYETASDNTVKANYSGAQIVEVESNLSSATAAAMAAKILNETKTVQQSYSQDVEQIMTVDDFAGGPPRWIMTDDRMGVASKTTKQTGFTFDSNSGRTTVQVRG